MIQEQEPLKEEQRGPYVGKLTVEVELDAATRMKFQSEGQVKIATMLQFYSRVTGIANQLGLQGRVINHLDIHQPLVPYRQTGELTFQEVSNGQLKKLRREAQDQARHQLRQGYRDHGADDRDVSSPGETREADETPESQGPRESHNSPGDQLILPFAPDKSD